MQFIEFYIKTYNSTTERVMETILVQLADAVMVNKFISEAEPISFSLEHFEED